MSVELRSRKTMIDDEAEEDEEDSQEIDELGSVDGDAVEMYVYTFTSDNYIG